MIVQRLQGGRLHLHHGPIDVVLRAWGEPPQVEAAEQAAIARFDGLLEELVAELSQLRRDVRESPVLRGAVARRMLAGCAPFAARGVFVTAMAAVAGAVADELLAAMRSAAPGMTKAFVNDGGDIAVFAGRGSLDIGMVALGGAPPPSHDAAHRGPLPPPHCGGGDWDGSLRIAAGEGIGGVATSGRHGRSFSLGIADAVTVLAKDAATADAAATLIANAVNLESPAIRRAPAHSLDPDSDLGDRLVTVAVEPLAAPEVEAALAAGQARAEAWCREGLLIAASLRLGGQMRFAGMPLVIA